MNNTKEKILRTALRLFAREGYEATSVQDIAAQLSITKGALYRHYAGKRAILEAIVACMARRDGESARENAVPEQVYASEARAYAQTTPEAVRSFALDRYRAWTQDAFVRDFRRMLSLERYRDPEMAALHGQYLSTGLLSYMEDIFREMLPGDPHGLALEFYGPMYFLMEVEAPVEELEHHIDRFFERHKEK